MSADRRVDRARRWVRWVTLGLTAAAVAVAGACANVSEPPGGPPDVQAPVILRITPDSSAVTARLKEVVVQFDEVISETPRTAQNLASLVFISPKSGVPEVDWGRDRISIKPSKGWRANTVYSVEVSPGITDLRNNGIDSTIRIVFSTGGAIPNTRLSGAAFDWVAGAGAPRALVEALVIDSAKTDTVAYQTRSDSSGRYDLRYMPPGPYLVRTVLDRNGNRALDPLEPWDTVRVTITQNTTADLYAFVRDTASVRITAFTTLDSGRTVKLTFDKPYAPGQFWPNEKVRIARADSSLLTVTKVVTPDIRVRDDSLLAAARADSIRRATTDTSALARARADTVARRRAADSIANAERALREERRVAALRGGRPVVRDTTPPPRFQRPNLYSELFVSLAQPVPDSTRLRVTVTAVRTLSGLARTTSREWVTPRPAPKPPARDSVTPARDTVAPAAARRR